MKKRVLTFALALTLIFTLTPLFAQASTTWQEAYGTYLNGKTGRFAIYDIDKNGTPELIICPSFNEVSFYTFSGTNVSTLTFANENMGEGTVLLTAPSNNEKGIIVEFSDSPRTSVIYFSTLNGNKLSTVKSGMEVGDMGSFDYYIGEKAVSNEEFRTVFAGERITSYDITAANIKAHITDTAPSSNPHQYAAALAEFFKDEKNYSSVSAYLVDLDGDGTMEVFAEKRWSNNNGACLCAVFYMSNGTAKTIKLEEYAWLSSAGYILTNPAGSIIVVYRFDKGELKQVSYNQSEYDKYGITDSTSTNRTDQTAQILAMTADQTSTTAVPTTANVFVNGKKTAFEAYNFSDNNYFKLRDLAYVVSGTNKQFNVVWDASKSAIIMTSKAAYTVIGGEMQGVSETAKPYTKNTPTVFVDGKEISLTAYNVNGNNFFKLRDIMRLFDIGVTWNGATSTIGIDTTIPYTD